MNFGSKLALHDDSGEEEVVKEQDLAAGPLGALVLWRAASLRPLNPAQTVRPRPCKGRGPGRVRYAVCSSVYADISAPGPLFSAVECCVDRKPSLENKNGRMESHITTAFSTQNPEALPIRGGMVTKNRSTHQHRCARLWGVCVGQEESKLATCSETSGVGLSRDDAKTGKKPYPTHSARACTPGRFHPCLHHRHRRPLP